MRLERLLWVWLTLFTAFMGLVLMSLLGGCVTPEPPDPVEKRRAIWPEPDVPAKVKATRREIVHE